MSSGGTWIKMEAMMAWSNTEVVPSSSDPSGSPTNGSGSTVKCSEDPVLDIQIEKLEDSEKIRKTTFREEASFPSHETFSV